MRKFKLNYERYDVPEHTREALENYFFHGFEPGGFVTSVLSNNLMGATNRCDHINREHIVSIAQWVLHNAPNQSWGSEQIVHDWIHDKDSRRTIFTEAFEKRLMWSILNEPQ